MSGHAGAAPRGRRTASHPWRPRIVVAKSQRCFMTHRTPANPFDPPMPKGFTLIETPRGHCHHRHLGGHAPAGRPRGAGNRPADPVHEQHQAVDPRRPATRIRPGLPANRRLELGLGGRSRPRLREQTARRLDLQHPPLSRRAGAARPGAGVAGADVGEHRDSGRPQPSVYNQTGGGSGPGADAAGDHELPQPAAPSSIRDPMAG